MSKGYNCSVHGWQPDVDDCPFCDLHGLITEYQNLPGRYSSALSEIEGLKEERSKMWARIHQLEAQNAVMREALRCAYSIITNVEDSTPETDFLIEKALSTTSGKDLLDKVQRYKEALNNVWMEANRYQDNSWINVKHLCEQALNPQPKGGVE